MAQTLRVVGSNVQHALAVRGADDASTLCGRRLPGAFLEDDDVTCRQCLRASNFRPCASCSGRCTWVDDAWVCLGCGDEWDEDHDPMYAPPT